MPGGAADSQNGLADRQGQSEVTGDPRLRLPHRDGDIFASASGSRHPPDRGKEVPPVSLLGHDSSLDDFGTTMADFADARWE
jgi:hypothetical protein